MKVVLAAAISAACVLAQAQDQSAMMIPPPPKELGQLSWMMGTWHGTETYHFGPQASKAHTTIVEGLALGGMYLKGDNVMHIKGMKKPGRGMSMICYDSQAKTFVGSWFDSMAPAPMTMKGEGNNKSLSLSGTMQMGPGEPQEFNAVWEKKSARHVVFTLKVKMGDKWTPMVEGSYTKG